MKYGFFQFCRRLMLAFLSITLLGLNLSAATADEPLIPYRVIIFTSNQQDAGSDDHVFITLNGQTKDSDESEFNNANIARARAASSVFYFPDVGDIVGVSIRVVEDGNGPGWLPERVIVSNELTGKKWLAKCEFTGAYSPPDDCWLHFENLNTTWNAHPYPGANKYPGEEPFNVDSFKAAHNSYQRGGESGLLRLNEELDKYNVWGLELDLHWSDGYFEVYHGGPFNDRIGERPMEDTITEIANSQTWADALRVTVLWLEIVEAPEDDTASYENYIRKLISDHLGWSQVYTLDEFQNQDGGRWPSWEELVRRGKNLIIAVQRPEHHVPTHRWFFEVVGDSERPAAPASPNSSQWDKGKVFYNTGIYNMLPLRSQERGDYWGSRMYPDSYCDYETPIFSLLPFLQENQEEHEVHVDTHATQVASNCILAGWENGRTMTSRLLHPPQPTYVSAEDAGVYQFGTSAYPYQGAGEEYPDNGEGIYMNGLMGAIQRVADYGLNVDYRYSASSEIWIDPGEYDLNAYGTGGVVISDPMILKAPNGVVDIH